MNQDRSFLEKIAQQFIKSKHQHYSQQMLSLYGDESRYLIEEINCIFNAHKQRLKCTLVRHRNELKQKIQEPGSNSICIIYLHGLGSNRLEALELLKYLPKNMCFCSFDFSGSGKSEGEYVTYGIKQYEDIEPIISYLFHKKYITEFVLWGRSMGAVAALFYANKNLKTQKKKKTKGIQSCSKSLKKQNKEIQKPIIQFEEGPMIKSIILDSPFQNFKDVARNIGLSKFMIPNFMMDMFLNNIEQTFSSLMKQYYKQDYNPFLINFQKKISLDVPILVIYSENDEIVPSSHFQTIIKNFESRCQKLLVNECKHNSPRPDMILQQIIHKTSRFCKIQKTQSSFSKQINQSTRKDSSQKRKGIHVISSSLQGKNIRLIGGSGQKIEQQRILRVDLAHTEGQYPKYQKKDNKIYKKNILMFQPARKDKRKLNQFINYQQSINNHHFHSFQLYQNNINSKTIKYLSQRQKQINFKSYRSQFLKPQKYNAQRSIYDNK